MFKSFAFFVALILYDRGRRSKFIYLLFGAAKLMQSTKRARTWMKRKQKISIYDICKSFNDIEKNMKT